MPRSLARFDRALRQWDRHLLGWPSGTPNASVLCELGLLDPQSSLSPNPRLAVGHTGVAQ